MKDPQIKIGGFEAN